MSKLTRKGKILIAIWAVFLIAFFAIITSFSEGVISDDRSGSEARHIVRMNGEKFECCGPENTEDAKEVTVGLYLDHIVELSTKNTSWTVDFYVWFDWTDSTISPGENFQVIEGEILSSKLLDSSHVDNEHYELYRVVANITKFFNVMRYPRDNHLLTISIESRMHDCAAMKFVADIENSQVSSRLKPPGYVVTKDSHFNKLLKERGYNIKGEIMLTTKQHKYKTNRGNPDSKEGESAVYDQVIFGVEISHPDWGLYNKMFLSLFASVAISFLVFFMKPGADRVGLGIGAFFAAVASSYITTSELPGVGILTLCDIINILGLLTIFLTVLSSVIVKQIASKEERAAFAKIFNAVSLGLFVVGYVVSNVIIAQAAS